MKKNDNHGQGRVTDPSTDGRLKENQGGKAQAHKGSDRAEAGMSMQRDSGKAMDSKDKGMAKTMDKSMDKGMAKDMDKGMDKKSGQSHTSHGQGRVTDPAHDKRLKENR